MKSRILAAALVLCAVLSVSACKTTPTNQTALATAKIATQYATAKYIARVPAAEQAAKAARVRAVVVAVESIATGETVSLAVLEGAIRKQLPADLKPEDLIAINGLIAIVMAELQARVGDGLLNPDQRLQVSMVASWVIEATAFYNPTQGA
jgi:hypothetical protein